jgi:hypothetical protein
LYTPLPVGYDAEAEKDYRAAFALLEQGDPQAVAHFDALQRQYPGDPLINYHCGRLQSGEISAHIKMGEK